MLVVCVLEMEIISFIATS